MCSYKSLLPQSCSHYSETERRTRQECADTSPYCLSPAVSTQKTERRTRQECAATSPYCLSPAVSTHRRREELDRNVQLQVLIASACSQEYSETERRTRQECAATSPYCLSPVVSTKRQREELDRNVQLQVLIASAPVVSNKKQREELDRNIQSSPYCSQSTKRQRRTRQECAATSPYCLSPVVSTKRQREELDRNVQLQVLIASALQSVLRDREKNQIGMCSYKSLLPQSCSQYSQTGMRRTRQECAATSPYCLSPAVSTHRQREELDRNVQLQVLIASVLQSVLRNREKNQIGMCSYKSLLPQSCSRYSQTERRTRQECAATSPYCLSPAVSTQRQREELDRNVQLQVLIASILQSVLTDREKNQIGMCSYKSLLPQPCSRYSQKERRTRQECAATSPY